MNIAIQPKKLRGSVIVPPSKSVAHRAIICASLSKGKSRIDNIELSRDISATLECVRALGVDWEYDEKASKLVVDSTGIFENIGDRVLNCDESGSTLRFMMPVSQIYGGKSIFTGRGRLMERPQQPFFDMFDKIGIKYVQSADGITLDGKLGCGRYELRGDISSQFVTGLLFALPLLEGSSEIAVTSPMESKGYIDLTLDVLKDFGIKIKNENYQRFIIEGNQKYISRDYTVEGDYSAAAFWLVANAIGNDVDVEGLNENSLQGDKAIVNIINHKTEKPLVIDAREIPDLVPILAVLCTFRKGDSKIINAGRLRIKESDRLAAVSSELNKLGARITEDEDFLIIQGVDKLSGGAVDSWGDHRIAMSLAIAATRASGDVTINGAESVEKSYPKFWEEYDRLQEM